MKKKFATLLLALTTMAASAQDNPNRLIIQPKQGNPSGYLVERLDSVYFTKINGRVAADINLQGYTTGATGDTLRLAVTKTPECQAYKIACLPASVANALTSDAVVAQYFDLYVGGDKFTEDFTNAVMTNMGIEFKPSSDYSVLTMGYDKYGIACASSRVDFSTPAANIIGNPTVTYKVLEANYEDFTIDFQPNEDCLGFYACAFEKGTAKAQYEQWGAMMGFANMGDMIKQWGGTMFADRETHTWKQMTPGTDYEVYVLPIDENQNYGTMVIVPVTTKKYGGAGQATVTITLGEFGSQEGKCYQYVTYTPNDQASFMRDMIIDRPSSSLPPTGVWVARRRFSSISRTTMMVLTPIGTAMAWMWPSGVLIPTRSISLMPSLRTSMASGVRCPSSSLPPVLPRWLLPRLPA